MLELRMETTVENDGGALRTTQRVHWTRMAIINIIGCALINGIQKKRGLFF